jgi:hypothetical protein
MTGGGDAEIADPDRPLGEHVYALHGKDRTAGTLRWLTTGSGKHTAASTDAAGHLRRVKVAPHVRKTIRDGMHHGMTVVTTDGKQTPVMRTANGFVVLGAGLY